MFARFVFREPFLLIPEDVFLLRISICRYKEEEEEERCFLVFFNNGMSTRERIKKEARTMALVDP